MAGVGGLLWSRVVGCLSTHSPMYIHNILGGAPRKYGLRPPLFLVSARSVAQTIDGTKILFLLRLLLFDLLLMGMFLLLCFTCRTLSSQMKIMIPSVNNTSHLESCFKPSTNMTSFILPALPGQGHSCVNRPGKRKPYLHSSPTRFSEAEVLTEHFHLSWPQI